MSGRTDGWVFIGWVPSKVANLTCAQNWNNRIKHLQIITDHFHIQYCMINCLRFKANGRNTINAVIAFGGRCCCLGTQSCKNFILGPNSHYLLILTSCLLACILVAYWLFIGTYKADIYALFCMTAF